MSEYEKTITQPKDRENFEAVKNAVVPYRACYDRVLALSHSRKIKEAIGSCSTASSGLYTKTSSTRPRQLAAFNRETVDHSIKDIEGAVKSAKTGILVFLGIALDRSFRHFPLCHSQHCKSSSESSNSLA